jgi:hypothetical protein
MGREKDKMKTNNKPLPVKDKLKTYNVFHGQKQIGQVQCKDVHEAYTQAREQHKLLPLAVIARKEEA